jgi:hypothetical protein
MNNEPTPNSQAPLHPDVASPGKVEPGGGATRSKLPEGWRRLRTGLRDSRLYRVQRPAGAAPYWEAETLLHNGWAYRRFASEIHARAWLYLAADTRLRLEPVGLEQMEGTYRFRL